MRAVRDPFVLRLWRRVRALRRRLGKALSAQEWVPSSKHFMEPALTAVTDDHGEALAKGSLDELGGPTRAEARALVNRLGTCHTSAKRSNGWAQRVG